MDINNIENVWISIREEGPFYLWFRESINPPLYREYGLQFNRSLKDQNNDFRDLIKEKLKKETKRDPSPELIEHLIKRTLKLIENLEETLSRKNTDVNRW